MKKHPRHTLLVLTAYLLLTIVMTWPTALHLSEAIPGDGFDGWQNYWNLWWVKQALLNLRTNPYFTDFLYAPTGVSLLFHTLNIFNALWTLPIQLNFGLAIAYNSVVFASFVLAGYGGYLVSLDMLARLYLPVKPGLRPAAFVGGLVFTMSPFHMAHLLGHMQVFSMIWPPFYVLWLLRTLEPWPSPEPTFVSRRKWRDVWLTCLFLILATLVDWYHTLYLLIFTGLALLWTLWQRWIRLRSRVASEEGQNLGSRSTLHTVRYLLRPFWLLIAVSLGFAVVLSPLLLPMVRAASSRPDLQTGLIQNITLSADLLAFVIPSEIHPLWGNWAKSIADNFSTTTSERLIFAGIIPLTLALFIAIRKWSASIVRFWVLIALAFAILALGPYLHIGGKIISLGEWPIPMPYLLLYHTVPFIGLTRSLSRYDLMVMLALGVLVAMALVKLQRLIFRTRQTKPSTRYALPLAAGILICFEFLPLPYPISKIEIPAFYYDIAADPSDYTIAELPMDWDRPSPLLHQTVHGKRLLTAYTSRNNPRELAWRTPVLQHWRNLAPDIIDQPLAEIAPTIFYDFNLRYILLDYWQMPSAPEREINERWLSAALPEANPIFDDGRLKVYQSPPMRYSLPYLTLGEGWAEIEADDTGSPSRAFVAAEENPPELFLHHPERRTIELEITASARTPQRLTVLADGQPVSKFRVTADAAPSSILLPARLAENTIKLTFISTNPAGPVQVSRIGLTVLE